jgi:hypothetical protein
METVLLAWGLGIITVFTTAMILAIFWLVRMYQDQRDELIDLEKKIYSSMEDIDTDHLTNRNSLSSKIHALSNSLTEMHKFQNEQLDQKVKQIYADLEVLKAEVNRLIRSY